MARTRVVLKGAGMRALLNDPGVVGHLEGLMAPALTAAINAAPVDTGAYAGSLSIWAEQHPTRTVVHLGSDVDHALAVEATHGVLSRALDSAGG